MSGKRIPIACQAALCLCCGKTHKDNTPLLLGTKFVTESTAKHIEEQFSEASIYQDCAQCTEYKKMGVILIGYDPARSDTTQVPEGFYRTGELLVVTDEGLQKLNLGKEVTQQALSKRKLFIPSQLAQELNRIFHT